MRKIESAGGTLLCLMAVALAVAAGCESPGAPDREKDASGSALGSDAPRGDGPSERPPGDLLEVASVAADAAEAPPDAAPDAADAADVVDSEPPPVDAPSPDAPVIECETDAQCDDHNLCTLEACRAGTCVRAPAPRGHLVPGLARRLCRGRLLRRNRLSCDPAADGGHPLPARRRAM